MPATGRRYWRVPERQIETSVVLAAGIGMLFLGEGFGPVRRGRGPFEASKVSYETASAVFAAAVKAEQVDAVEEDLKAFLVGLVEDHLAGRGA